MEDEEEGERVLKARRVRVIGVLKAWMEDYFADFGEDEEFLELLSQFIEVNLEKNTEIRIDLTSNKTNLLTTLPPTTHTHNSK